MGAGGGKLRRSVPRCCALLIAARAQFENYMRDAGVTDMEHAGCTPKSVSVLDPRGNKVYRECSNGLPRPCHRFF